MERQFYTKLIRLTTDGGKRIMQKVIATKVTGKSLDDLLRNERENLDTNRELTDNIQEILFPKNGEKTRVKDWDLTLMIFIVLQLFKETLTEEEKAAIEGIENVRKELYLNPTSAFETKSVFSKWRTRLEAHISELNSTFSDDENLEIWEKESKEILETNFDEKDCTDTVCKFKLEGVLNDMAMMKPKPELEIPIEFEALGIMAPLTEVQRGQAILLQIQRQRHVAMQFGLNVSTIERLVNRLRETRRVAGRPLSFARNVKTSRHGYSSFPPA